MKFFKVSSKRRNRAEKENYKAGILTDKSSWAFQEAYRALRTNILFTLPGNETKVIGVTSSVMGEGKTTTGINLAISFAEIGKKVLIIDGDLRRPTVALRLGISSAAGLTDFLIGQCEFDDIFQRDVRKNLDVIIAGSIPPDPTWLLQSEQFETLINTIKSFYDYIILDLPSINVVADASIVKKYVSGYLLIVRNKKAQYPDVKKALEQLEFTGGRLIGVVYSDVKQDKGKYYHRNYKADYR